MHQLLWNYLLSISKAFDKIPRHILLKKLVDHGVTGKFYDIIVNMYKNDKSCVKINGKLSPEFNSLTGVKQGCIMSPLLFNIFMSDLPSALCQEDNVMLDNTTKINCILWADDILILSETEEGLQKSLQNLHEYCNTNKLSVNMDKTQCMIFNKSGDSLEDNLSLGKKK